MPFSKDPFMYDADERELLIAALSKPIRCDFDTDKTTMYVRHRMYALRKAVIDIYDKNLIAQHLNKPAPMLENPLIMLAPHLREVNIAYTKGDTHFIIGRGVATAKGMTGIRAGLINAGFETHQQQLEAKTGEINWNSFEERIAKQATGVGGSAAEDHIPENFRTGLDIGKNVSVKLDTDVNDPMEVLVARHARGELLSPEENKQLTEHKQTKARAQGGFTLEDIKAKIEAKETLTPGEQIVWDKHLESIKDSNGE